MYKTTRMLVVCAIAALPISARSDAEQTVFEIADVHAVPSAGNSNMRGGVMRGGRYELHSATMVDPIRTAYGVDADKVVGGPGWLDTGRFDVIAKGPVDASPESIRMMLRGLLAERFGLVTHNDTRPSPEYALKAGRHSRLKETIGGDSGCVAAPQNGQTVTYSCHNITMAEFAARLPRMAGNYFQLTPVVDLTGLIGSWDFTVAWTPRNLLSADGVNAVTVYDAIDIQLGVKLDVQNVPMPVVVVDRVNEKPAGVSQSLPAIPTEFEVAVIKPSAPGSKESFRLEPGDRIDLRGVSLRKLIKFAWDLQDNDVRDNDEMLLGGPKWLESERFDIVARPAVSEGGSTRAPVDVDAIRMMLRRLLEDRFKLVTHTEQRPVNVYALVGANPKLKRADPSNRSGCRNVPALPEKKNVSGPMFSLSCVNITMAQLAERLQPIGGIYITHPVIDATGLAGAWDFVLSWSPPHLLQGCGGCGRDAGLAAAAVNTASDPFGSLSVVEALDKQLGLKLRLEKHAMPVVVIDSVQQRPSDN
jgi:uncharacterized protein (TIGR03435 family)